MKRAILITNDRYPNGDAGAVRTGVFARLLRDAGYAPFVIGFGTSTRFRDADDDGIPYVSLRSVRQDLPTRVWDRRRFASRAKKRLSRLAPGQDDVIFIEAAPTALIEYLKKRPPCPVIYDAVEWYSPQEFPNGEQNRTYRLNDKLNREVLGDPLKVVAISSYLQRHFESRKVPVSRIPVILDVQNAVCEKKTAPDKCVFAYAGMPGPKDYLKVAVGGFALAKAQTDRAFEVRLIGVTKEQLITLCGCDEADINALGDTLRCFGRVPRSEVLENLKETDFTFLLRPEDLRYAKAGFPTKFVESLSSATPMIANLTSDIGMYLKDGENGFAVAACDAAAFADAVSRALALSFEQRTAMQSAARNTAETQFDYRLYTDTLLSLINQ